MNGKYKTLVDFVIGLVLALIAISGFFILDIFKGLLALFIGGFALSIAGSIAGIIIVIPMAIIFDILKLKRDPAVDLSAGIANTIILALITFYFNLGAPFFLIASGINVFGAIYSNKDDSVRMKQTLLTIGAQLVTSILVFIFVLI